MNKVGWSIEKINMFLKKNWLYMAVIFSLILVGAGVQYLAYQNQTLFQENEALVDNGIILGAGYTRTYIALKDTEKELSKYRTDLEVTTVERNALEQNLGQEKEKVVELTGTVDVLEKLTTLDPELLKKYSKIFFLNEHYTPAQPFAIPNEYKYLEEREVQIDVAVWPYLQKLLAKAKADGVTIYVLSGYRSFGEQGDLKSKYSVTYGAGTANQFSADQGYSEHQLGTTVDLITTGLGGQLDGFDGTTSFAWLQANAHKYGFVLSYPKNNSYYIFEPWHWRFVGVKLATDLHNQGKFFYDLDQRTLDGYLLYIFD